MYQNTIYMVWQSHTIMNTEIIRGKIDKPIFQAIVLVLSCLLLQMLAFLIYNNTSAEVALVPWIISGAFTLLYAFFSAIMLLKTRDINAYLIQSVAGYVIVLLLGGGLAYAFSLGVEGGFDSMRLIYSLITFSFFVFLTIVFFMRKIIEYAQRQDPDNR